MKIQQIIYKMNNNSQDYLTMITPAGTTKQQIKKYIIKTCNQILENEQVDFNHIYILSGLIKKIETEIIYNNTFNTAYVFFASLDDKANPDIEFSQLLKDDDLGSIIHLWDNFPDFGLVKSFMKDG